MIYFFNRFQENLNAQIVFYLKNVDIYIGFEI